jgi:hypothetical protein
MAKRKTTTPVKKKEENKTMYIVVPEESVIKNGHDVTVYNSVTEAYYDTQANYDTDPSKDKYVVYEVVRKGYVTVNVDVEIS